MPKSSRLNFGDVQDGELVTTEASITTDENGNLVILDSDETVILRHDETSGSWQFENVNITDVADFDAASASVTDAPTEDTDVVRKTENDEKVDQTAFDSHATRHEQGGADELAVDGLSGDLADPQDPKTHNDAHGYQGNDELATALKYDPIAEPETPTEGCVRWFDNTENAYKVKFDDGTAITVGEK